MGVRISRAESRAEASSAPGPLPLDTLRPRKMVRSPRKPPQSTRCSFRKLFLLGVAAFLAQICIPGLAQAREGTLSEREVDTLRDAAFVPADRIFAYTTILNTREKLIEDLVAKPHHLTYARDLHDYMEQFAAIVDELNDNLDDYRDKHRDLRKALPKLVQATERWSTSLRAPEEKQEYKIVRRLALDALKDTRELAESLEVSQAEYFKAHPEAAKAEKDRVANPHAIGNSEPQ